MGSLEDCHGKLCSILGTEIEPVEVFRIADQYRRFWRPEKVRTILLAESHVHTSGEEATLTITLPANITSLAPRSFVRLVYCLGYGENELVYKPIIDPKNSGTWQFWQVFYSCLKQVTCNEDFAAIQKARTPDLHQRIQNKLGLLEQLKQAGVWLVDGSLAALYLPGRGKPQPVIRQQALEKSWDYYVGEQIIEAKPEHIICIGNGVRNSLKSRLTEATSSCRITTVKQPNARMSACERFQNFKTYFEICSRLR